MQVSDMGQQLEISVDKISDQADYRLDLKFYSPSLAKGYSRLFTGRYAARSVGSVADSIGAGIEIEDNKEYKYLQIGDVDGEMGEVLDHSVIVGDELPTRAKMPLLKNDIAVSSVRPRLREIAIVPEELDREVGTNGFVVLRCKSIEPEFLHHMLRATPITDELERRSRSLNYPTINESDLLQLKIPYPPKDVRLEMIKQFKSATRQTNNLRNETKNLAVEHRRLLKMLLKSDRMVAIESDVTYRIDETENNDYRMDVKFYKYSRKHPYEHLALEPINTLAAFNHEEIDLQEIPDEEVTQITASRNRGIVFRDRKLAKVIKTKNQRIVRAGNIVISRIDLYNKCLGIVPEDLDGAVVTKDFLVVKPDVRRIDPVYFVEVLRDDLMSDYFYAFCTGATGRKRITEDVFKGLKIPLLDKRAQDRIKKHAVTTDRRIRELQQKARVIYSKAEDDFLHSLGITA